jgi:hypothetical protein
MPRIRRILETLAVIVAFVVAFLLVKEFKTSLFTSASMQEASDTTTASAEKKIKIAQDQASPNKSTTETLSEKAHSDINTTLNSVKTDKEKFVAASNFFFGAYFLNTRSRAEYCASRGIKIDRFVSAYEQTNHDLFVSAEKYQIEDLRDHGYAYDIAKLYKIMSPTLEKYVVQDMTDIAAKFKISEREVCQSFEQNAPQWAEGMDYRKRVPEGAQILLMQ